MNHVSKRLGTRLRKLKDSLKEPITTKSGTRIQRSELAGAKGLPDSVIDKLTAYYGQNIRKFPKDGAVQDLKLLILSATITAPLLTQILPTPTVTRPSAG